MTRIPETPKRAAGLAPVARKPALPGDAISPPPGVPGTSRPAAEPAPSGPQPDGTPSSPLHTCNTASHARDFPAAGTRTPARGGLDADSASLAGLQAAAMSEDELEEQIRDACKKLGILRFHVRYSKGTTAGLPDDILIGPRGILWRECKNQVNSLTPAQVKTGEALMVIGQDWATWRPGDWFSGRIRRELAAISGLKVGAA